MALDFPVIERGEGPFLYDLDGQRYFDGIASWWCAGLGHSHPAVVDAIRTQAGALQHSILGNLSHPRAAEVADRLTKLFPSQPRRVFFGSDGASAVEAALKVAVQYWDNVGRPERNRFLSLSGAYHGDTLGAVSVGFMDAFHHSFSPVVFDSYTAPRPCAGVRGFGLEDHVCGDACCAPALQLIEDHAAELAAVILEPLCQGAAGMMMYASDALARVEACCKQHDVLLIVDEIATGFGRTGKMFSHQHAGCDPDIICLGKGLSAGSLPISATVVTQAIHKTFDDSEEDRTFYHGHTFGGNPIACAASLAALDAYTDPGLWSCVEQNAATLRDGLRGLLSLNGIRDARCLGMIAAVEFDGPPRQMHAELVAQGILVRPLGNVIYLVPPLNTDPALLHEVTATFTAAAKAEAQR